MNLNVARTTLELVSFALSLVVVWQSFRIARYLRSLDGGTLCAHMFLWAPALRKFFVWIAIATAVFVIMPSAEFATIVTDQNAFEVVHDVSHLLFVLCLITGLQLVQRATMRATTPSKRASGSEV